MSDDDQLPAKQQESKPHPNAHVPTEDRKSIVLEKSRKGVPHHVIARSIGISKPTLYKYYREELDEGKEEALEKLEGKAFEMALEGDNAHHLHWMLERLDPEKWSRTAELDVTSGGEKLGAEIVTYLPDNGRGRDDDSADGS